jgi:hypothetical protein
MRSQKQNPVVLDIAELPDQLRRLAANVAALVKAAGGGEPGSYTIKQFLARHNLSESQFHKLRREGRGPRTMRTGSVGVRISRAAERDWVLEREGEAAEVDANATPAADGQR